MGEGLESVTVAGELMILSQSWCFGGYPSSSEKEILLNNDVDARVNITIRLFFNI